MKNLILLSVFVISSLFSSNDIAFLQKEKSPENGTFKAKFEIETVSDDLNIRPYTQTISDISITIKENKIIDIMGLPLSENFEQLKVKFLGNQIVFNEKGISKTLKISEYIKNDRNDKIPGKWVYYSFTIDSSDKL